MLEELLEKGIKEAEYDAWLMTNYSRTVYSLNGRLLRHKVSWKPNGPYGMGGKITRSDQPAKTVLNLEYPAPVFVDGARNINNTLEAFATSANHIRDHWGNGVTFGALDGHVENLKYMQNQGTLSFDGLAVHVKKGDWYFAALWYPQ